MKTDDPRSRAERTRQDWRDRTARVRRSQARNALAPPQFNPGEITDPSDGTVLAAVLHAAQGLAVLIPRWQNASPHPEDVDTVQLWWAAGDAPAPEDYALVDMATFQGPGDADSFPLPLRLQPEYLSPDGRYWLRYTVITANGASADAAPVPLTCDRIPPWGNAAPPVAGIPGVPITDDYLDGSPLGVALTIPDYAGMQPGDQVQYWWTLGLPEDPTTLPPLTVPVDTAPLTVHVPTQTVHAIGDGGCYLTYRVLDKAGNLSRLSTPVRLAVALGALPQPLHPPQVPLADDGLLDLKDAMAGIDVVIPAFANGKPSDRVAISWGGKALLERPLGDVPGRPFVVRVPAQILREAYGTATGPVATEVGYRILRGDVVFGPQQVTVNVDLYVAGPDLPEWPDPVNPLLSAPRVFGAVSATQNVLTRDDGNAPAAVRFDLYTPLHAGEIIDFYWDGVQVTEATYIVADGDLPDTEKEVFIPWAYIANAGNHPQLPVHYRLRGATSPNEQHSPTTLVNADAFTLTPPAPTFLYLNANGQLSCTSLNGDDHAVVMAVPDLSEWLQPGDVVTVTWTPFWNRHDNMVELTDAIKTEQIVLSDQSVTGFEWRISPYQDHVLPIYEYNPAVTPTGTGRIEYGFTFENEAIRSAREERMVAMFIGNDPCPITR